MRVLPVCLMALSLASCTTSKAGDPLAMSLSEPHRHVAEGKPNPATEGKIPPGEKNIQLSKPIEAITCDDYEKLAKLSCLFPNQKVPFPICSVDDAYAISGILPYAFCTKDVNIIDIHMAYAKEAYAGSTVGLLERMQSKLKKEEKAPFTRPLIYVEKLTGEDAHLMMNAIWNEWHISGVFTDGMKHVIEEQARREPDCLFYQYLHDSAQGNFDGSLALALDARSNCEYYKNYDQDERTIDIVFVQSLIVRAMK